MLLTSPAKSDILYIRDINPQKKRMHMTTQMIIRIDQRQRQKLNQLSRAEGKATSQVVRELIDDFIKGHDIGNYIDDLWSRIGKTFTNQGYTAKNVQRFVREYRKAAR
jgi:predicted DNA-binding protein